MSLAKAIHARWAESAGLDGLLPAVRVSTGPWLAGTAGGPYATVELDGGRSLGHANDGSSLDEAVVRIRVHDRDYTRGAATAAAVTAAFDRSDFDLAAGDRVIAMRRSGPPREQRAPDLGVWEWMIPFSVLIARGA